MIYFRNALEIFFAVLAVAIVSMFLGYAWPDKDYGLSGWVQAVGSVLAIFAAGHIASSQARRQFEDARRLQLADKAERALATAKATARIARQVVNNVGTLINEIADDSARLHRIAVGKRHFDRNILEEIRADLEAIPMHELLSSRLVENLILMRPIAKGVSQSAEAAIARQVEMEPPEFQAFFGSLLSAENKLQHHARWIEEVVGTLEGEIRSYTE